MFGTQTSENSLTRKFAAGSEARTGIAPSTMKIVATAKTHRDAAMESILQRLIQKILPTRLHRSDCAA